MSEKDGAQGWGWPGNSKKAHFFSGGRSLCGRWMFFGALSGEAAKQGEDDCRECCKRISRSQALSPRAPKEEKR